MQTGASNSWGNVLVFRCFSRELRFNRFDGRGAMEEEKKMKTRVTTILCILACLAIAIPMMAQRGGGAADPVSGSWTGDWGPSAQDRNSITVDLKLEGKTLTGTVKSVRPARPDVALTKSTFDAGKVHMEANSPRSKDRGNPRYLSSEFEACLRFL